MKSIYTNQSINNYILSNMAGVNLHQDLQYILKDITQTKSFPPDDLEEIIKLCLITICNIYKEYDEKEVRTFVIDHLEITKSKKSLTLLTSSKSLIRSIAKPSILMPKSIDELIIKHKRKIEMFEKLPQYKQKSLEWLLQRQSYITASIIAAALSIMGQAARRDLLLNKASYGELNKFMGNFATHWGNKYEPVANPVYSYRNNNVKIHEFGMITNEKYPILGISPDGITDEGKMLEIKCPYSRFIDGKIKKEYYHQMQAQMTVCEYDKCDFLECKFEEIDEERFWDDFDYFNEKENPNREKGIIITYIDISGNSLPPQYLYSPINLCVDQQKMKEWLDLTIKQTMENPNYIIIQKTYWNLIIYSCQSVDRDTNWIVTNYPILQAFWDEVEYYRQVGVSQLQDQIEKEKDKKKHLGDDEMPPNENQKTFLDFQKNSQSNPKNSKRNSPTSGGICLL